MPADLEALVELGVRFSVIESPISDLKLDAIGVSREKMLDRITSAMRFAAEHGIHAAFFGVDSTRAEPRLLPPGVLERDRGRARRRSSSSTRSASPRPRRSASSSASTVELAGPDVPVHFHGHNDFGVATASAVAAVRAGASYVQGTINGMGERAGNANLGEVALTLRALYGVESNLRLDRIRAVSERVRELSGLRARAVEARDRRDALPARERRGREPVPRPAVDRAVLVGARRAPSARSCSARRAALDSIRIKAEELGPRRRPRSAYAELLAAVKELGTRKRGLVDRRGVRRARPPGRRLIERVCVAGAGVIGSLFAGHLAQVAEVSVLTRREEHARALNEEGLRVSGRSDLHGRV